MKTEANTQPRRRHRRRTTQTSLSAEIKSAAKQIHDLGMAEAMKAASLVIVARKLDEIKSLLVASGFSAALYAPTATPGASSATAPSPPLQLVPQIKNPCCQCGRESVYRTKPNQFNRTGSWYCRIHMVLGAGIEAEDKFDRTMNMAAVPDVPSAPPARAPEPAPGASTLAEAMGTAQLEES